MQEQAKPGEVAELFDLRALGQELRAYGSAEASGDPYQLVRARRALVTAVTRARGLGDDRLLGLRSYQSELFLTELWLGTRARLPKSSLASRALSRQLAIGKGGSMGARSCWTT